MQRASTVHSSSAVELDAAAECHFVAGHSHMPASYKCQNATRTYIPRNNHTDIDNENENDAITTTWMVVMMMMMMIRMWMWTLALLKLLQVGCWSCIVFPDIWWSAADRIQLREEQHREEHARLR